MCVRKKSNRRWCEKPITNDDFVRGCTRRLKNPTHPIDVAGESTLLKK